MGKRPNEQMIHDVENQPPSKIQCDDGIKLPKIFDGTYYEVVELDRKTKNISARCKKCIKEKIIKGQTNTTGNFYQHFSRSHIDDHKALKEYCDGREKRSDHKLSSTKSQTILPFATSSVDPMKVIFENFSAL